MASPEQLYEYTTVFLKYAALLGLTGGLYLYYHTNQRDRRGNRVRPQRAASLAATSTEAIAPSSEPRTPRERRRERRRDNAEEREVPSSDDGASSDRVRRSRANPAPAQVQPAFHAGLREKESDTDDLAFANELASRKKGTSLTAPTRADSSQKTVKQSSANKYVELAPSPSIEAEVDDDLSSAASPNLQAGEFPSGKNVEDMLEAPAPGPSVLRLTESEKPQKQKQAGKQRPVQQQETKKQRQNRKKVEEQKKIREQLEEERRILLEKQRRTAREARGEPAKNGIPATVPTSNAWNKANGVGAVQPPTADSHLLDTFVESASTGSSAAPGSPVSNSTGDFHWERGLPDEDEQMRRILEQDETTWTTVPAGRRNRRKEVINDIKNEVAEASVNGAAPAVRHVLEEQEA